MKIVIAVSGTGGHIYPGISFAEYAKNKGDEVLFFCNDNPTTQDILSTYDFKFLTLKTVGWNNRRFFALIKALWFFVFAFLKASVYILKYEVDVILGFGGYLSVPVGFAAKFLKKRVIIHEQNSFPGLSNRILNKFAYFTALGFEESGEFFKNQKSLIFTGNPVRKEFYGLKKLETPKKTILILGGSQGAKGINRIISKSLYLLYDYADKISFIHIAGKNDQEFVKAFYEDSPFSEDYKVYDYYENIYEFFAQASLVVCRSGASTIAEILTIGVPAIFIPYPYATEDHQTKNSEILKNKGIAEIFSEENIDIRLFVKTLKKMLFNEELKLRSENISEFFKNNNFSENLYKLCQEIQSKKF